MASVQHSGGRGGLFDQLWTEASQPGARLVVTGPIGVGKTRLLEDLAAHARGQGLGVVTLEAAAFDGPGALVATLRGVRPGTSRAVRLVLVDGAEAWRIDPAVAAAQLVEASGGDASVVIASRRAPGAAGCGAASVLRVPPVDEVGAREILVARGVRPVHLARVLEACAGVPLLLVRVAEAIAASPEAGLDEAIAAAMMGLADEWSPSEPHPHDTLALAALALAGEGPAEMIAAAVDEPGYTGEEARRALRRYRVVQEGPLGLLLDEAARRVFLAELFRHAPRAMSGLLARLRRYFAERVAAEPGSERWVLHLLRLPPDGRRWPAAAPTSWFLPWMAEWPASPTLLEGGSLRVANWYDDAGMPCGGLERVGAMVPGMLEAVRSRLGLPPEARLGAWRARAPDFAAPGIDGRIAVDVATELFRLPLMDGLLLVDIPLPAACKLAKLFGEPAVLEMPLAGGGTTTALAWALPGGPMAALATRGSLLVPAPAPLRAPEPVAATPPPNAPPALEALIRERVEQLSSTARLSAREREVLDLLLLGRSASEIGIALGITARTAKFHQANVLAKLGAESKLDLMRVLF